MTNTFIISWDQLGVECVFNATEADQQITFEMLQNTYDQTAPRQSSGSILPLLKLRAQFNPQRHYEIYAIEVEQGIDQNDIKNMFEQDPQGSADLVRSRGSCLYSNRQNLKELKIT
jgi:hypothetical protein